MPKRTAKTPKKHAEAPPKNGTPFFSVFTPTHDPKHLRRVGASLTAQTWKDFEWLILPNGACRLDISPHPRARIVPAVASSRHVGALKLLCCQHAAGEVLVELDHDDELTPDCLEALREAFADPECDFAYSNHADVREDGQPVIPYRADHGWEHRRISHAGQDLVEMVAFPPSPAAFAKIWYAPNHVRAWRRTFYHALGGHNPSMPILDDQELLCRTYVGARKMVHIDRCLYHWRRHDGNTSRGAQNAMIQSGTMDLHDRFIYPMAAKWCDLHGLRKIDLCGGHNCPEGFESVDLHHGPIRFDLNRQGWPFEPGSVGVFRAHDALEHLHRPINTMREIERALAPMGWLLSLTPSTDGRGGWQDPTHVSFWNSNSFWYYTQEGLQRFISHETGGPIRFQSARVKNFFPNEHCKAHNIVYVAAHLMKLEGAKRVPGPVEI